MDQETGNRPLAGLRVLDLTRVVSGPYCTRMLADCGAEVIKVEPPGGEHMRRKQPVRDGLSSYFGHLNVGKRSVEVDLYAPAGQRALRRLAATCDVVVENFRPGVTAALGLDYPTLAAIRPDLVYCSISGFGQDGPRARQPAYAPVIHATCGHDLAVMQYQRGQDRPPATGVYYADMLAGIYAFGAIQTALLARGRSGQGEYIDVSLLDAMVNLMVPEVQEAQFAMPYPRWMFRPVRAADGFVVATPVSARNFEQLTEVVDRPDWRQDPRFATPTGRERHWDALMAELEAWTSQRPAAECERLLATAGVPCARYRTVAEAMRDPHLVERGLFRRVDDDAGGFEVPALPFRFATVDVGVQGRVAELGADNGLLGSERAAAGE
ncbi:CoA transferase [Thalassobaculum sp.]|uniref:CaiB/BaiF CoA transferase family protein n=1 Tax=Thalassobaculum sp. TaxID=2022740 RepID=UPI0032EC6147